MKSSSPRPYFYDDRREISFLITMGVFWILVTLFLVLRDPLWRLFYEGQIVAAPQSQQSGWMGMDETLIAALTKVDVSPRAGVDKFEDELVEAIRQRAATEATAQHATVTPQLNWDAQLRDVSRARAQARAQVYISAQEKTPELIYPEIYLALIQSNRLLRVVESAQVLTLTPTAGSTIPSELVGGWMNNLSFANMIQNPANVDVGVGVTAMQSGGSSIDVLLVQSFVQLDSALPAVTNKETPLQLSGHRLSADEVTLYLMGPQDPSFAPLGVQWNGDQFTVTIPWGQGPGIYALRARRLDRLSDPRPILVK
jgi:hypothetical protein